MGTTSKKVSNLNEVLAKAKKDKKFKERLLGDPKTTLKDEALSLKADELKKLQLICAIGESIRGKTKIKKLPPGGGVTYPAPDFDFTRKGKGWTIKQKFPIPGDGVLYMGPEDLQIKDFILDVTLEGKQFFANRVDLLDKMQTQLKG